MSSTGKHWNMSLSIPVNGLFSVKFQRKAFGVTHGARSSLTPILSICWLMFKVPVNPWVTIISVALGAVADNSLLEGGDCLRCIVWYADGVHAEHVVLQSRTECSGKFSTCPGRPAHIHVWVFDFSWKILCTPLPSAPSSSNNVCEPSEDFFSPASVVLCKTLKGLRLGKCGFGAMSSAEARPFQIHTAVLRPQTFRNLIRNMLDIRIITSEHEIIPRCRDEPFASYVLLPNVYLQSKIMVNAKTWTLAVLDRERPLSGAVLLRECAHQRRGRWRCFVWRHPSFFSIWGSSEMQQR